jgi:nucleotide-binding universal stress UspA family protein
LTERNLLSTRVGAVTIACAAIDDVTAWCILAGVIAFVRTSAGGGLLVTFGGSALYATFMIVVARRALRGLEAYYHNRGRLTRDAVAFVLLLVLASAWVTEWIGIHALFGAFLVGAVMPKDKGFVHDLTTRLMDFTLVLLLPLFFAFTGLRTRIGLLDDPNLWGDCALVTLVAIAGKLGGGSLAARLSGLSWREAGALGVLMNTRGLMELVILTIGLDLGVISPTVFVMMVIMALATTFMTTPVLEWIYPARLMRKARIPMESSEGPRKYTVLVPIALPSSGPLLFDVARALAPAPRLCVYGVHLSRPADFQMTNLDSGPGPADQEALRPFLARANAEKVEVRPLAFVSRSFGEDVAEVAQAKGVDLILLGWHKPVINQSVLGGTVYDVISHAKVDVAVSIPRKPSPWRRVLLPYSGGFHDDLALKLGDRIVRHAELELTILHVVKAGAAVRDPMVGLSEQARTSGRVSVRRVESDNAEEVAVSEARTGYDLVIIGASESWGLEPRLLGMWHEQLAESCPASMLIVRRQRPPESGDGLARTPALAGKDV